MIPEFDDNLSSLDVKYLKHENSEIPHYEFKLAEWFRKNMTEQNRDVSIDSYTQF